MGGWGWGGETRPPHPTPQPHTPPGGGRMRQYILGRLVQLVVVMIGISVITFCLTFVLGDPVAVLLPLDAPKETRDLFRREMGLDQPLLIQYGRFASGAIHGDFGESFVMKKSAL